MRQTIGGALAVLAGLGLAATAGATSISIPDGSLTSTGSPWGWEYGGPTAPYHVKDVDVTTLNGGGPVAIRGWVDLSDTPVPTGWSKFYFAWHATDQTLGWSARKELKANFASGVLGPWHGMPSTVWERVRLEQLGLASTSGEEWYITEGGTHDMGGGGPIYATDHFYYFQSIIDPATLGAELWVYANGNAGGVAPPNSINSTPDKAWYQVSTGSAAGMDLTDIDYWPLLFNSDQIGPNETTTIRWYGMEVGAPISLQEAPPPVPEPMTMAGLGLGLVGLARYLRKRK